VVGTITTGSQVTLTQVGISGLPSTSDRDGEPSSGLGPVRVGRLEPTQPVVQVPNFVPILATPLGLPQTTGPELGCQPHPQQAGAAFAFFQTHAEKPISWTLGALWESVRAARRWGQVDAYFGTENTGSATTADLFPWKGWE
jgi:hypothetical protein